MLIIHLKIVISSALSYNFYHCTRPVSRLQCGRNINISLVFYIPPEAHFPLTSHTFLPPKNSHSFLLKYETYLYSFGSGRSPFLSLRSSRGCPSCINSCQGAGGTEEINSGPEAGKCVAVGRLFSFASGRTFFITQNL